MILAETEITTTLSVSTLIALITTAISIITVIVGFILRHKLHQTKYEMKTKNTIEKLTRNQNNLTLVLILLAQKSNNHDLVAMLDNNLKADKDDDDDE